MWSEIFIPDPDFSPSRIRIPDPGVKKTPDPGSATLIFIRLPVSAGYRTFFSFDIWELKNRRVWSVTFSPLASFVTLRTLPTSPVCRRLNPPNPRQRQQNRRRPTGTPTPQTQVALPLSFCNIHVMDKDSEQFGAVFRVRNICIRIRICSLHSGSEAGSCFFVSGFKDVKKFFSLSYFFTYYLLYSRYVNICLLKNHVIKQSKNSLNQDLYFCFLMEGSGSVQISTDLDSY